MLSRYVGSRRLSFCSSNDMVVKEGRGSSSMVRIAGIRIEVYELDESASARVRNE